MEEFPLEIRDVDPELNKQLLQDFDGERTGWVQVGPEGYLLPSSYKIHGPRLYNFKVRPDDTWIVTFPRSGTTLSQEMIWLIANQMDFETASKVTLIKRFPFIEFCLFVNDKFMDEYRARYSSEPEKLAMIDNLCTPTYKVLDVTPSPRFIKTHLPFSLLPPNLLESGAKPAAAKPSGIWSQALEAMEEFPLEIRDVDPELNKQLLQDFDGERTGWVQVGPERYLLPSSYKIHGPRLYNFKVRPDDTWIVTFPRSGTTLSQEMIWLIANQMDLETASKENLSKRFPFIEFCLFMNDKFMDEYRARYSSETEKLAMIDNLCTPTYEVLDVTPSPRFIKTHLPFSLLPPNLLESGAKVIYVARNPKDVAVSFYHQNRLLRIMGFQNDFHRYWDYFQRNLIPWAPFWSHVTEAWGLRQNPNLLFLFYEDIVKNIPSTIRGVGQFLNKTVTEEQVTQLAAHLHIDTFRNNPSIEIPGLQELDMIRPGEQGFIRKGKSGGWSEEFTPDLQEKAYQWIQENLQKTDIRFPLFNSKFK